MVKCNFKLLFDQSITKSTILRFCIYKTGMLLTKKGHETSGAFPPARLAMPRRVIS